MVATTEHVRQYENDVDAISAERRRKINSTAQQERDAEQVAKSFGLRFECRDGDGGGYLRNVTYCIFRRSWNIAQYCPNTGKLTIGGGLKVVDADTLPKAIELAAKHEGCAPKVAGQCEQSIPPAPVKKGKKPKKTHKPKKSDHQAKGQKLSKSKPTLFLTDDDVNRALAALDFMAGADEATGVDAISLNRELAERIREALAEDDARIIYERKNQQAASGMQHWELN